MIIWMVGWVSIWCFYIILNVFVLIFDHCCRNFSRDRTQRVSHKDAFCCLNIGAKVGEFERQPLCIFCWNFVVDCHCHPKSQGAGPGVCSFRGEGCTEDESGIEGFWDIEPDQTGETHIPSWFLDFVRMHKKIKHRFWDINTWLFNAFHGLWICQQRTSQDIWIQDGSKITCQRPPGRWEARVWQVAGGSRVGDRAGNQRTGRPIATSVLLVER